MSWITDNKGQGPWSFTEQPNKFGYLNNPRWSSLPKAVEFSEAVGNPIDTTDTHKPCGHWHKNSGDEVITVTRTSTTIFYESITGWWWQPSVDVREGVIGLVPMRYDNDPNDGIVGLVYDVETSTWSNRGEVLDIAIIMGEPNTCRVAEDYMAYYCTCYDEHPWDTNLMYNRIYIFEEGEEPRYTDVWSTNYITGTPYEASSSYVYNVMDCSGDRIACAALLEEIDGVTTDKWQIKISNDAGLTFPTEYLFAEKEGSNDNVQLRISADGIIWVLYARIDTGSVQNVELWKSNAGATSFSKIWEHAFYTDTGHKYPEISLGISDADGQYITIGLFRRYTPNYGVIYSSDDYGITFATNIHTTSFYPYGIMAASGRYIVVPGSGIFKRSTDHGINFSELAGTIKYRGNNNYCLSTINKSYVKNNIITNNRYQTIAPVIGSRIVVAAQDITLTGFYADIQNCLNEASYVECGESFYPFTQSDNFQGLLYSNDNGATWIAIQSPAALIEDPDEGYQEVTRVSVEAETFSEPQVWPM